MLSGVLTPRSGTMQMDDWDNKALILTITKSTNDTDIYCALKINISISPDPMEFSLRYNNIPTAINTTITITIDNSTIAGALILLVLNNIGVAQISGISLHSGIANTSDNGHITVIDSYVFKVSITPSTTTAPVCTLQHRKDNTDTTFNIIPTS